MPTPPSPWTARAYELLDDGQWHDEELILNQLVLLVPPGKALRKVEKDRARQTPGREGRSRPRSTEYLVASGARSLVRDAMAGRLQVSVVDGRRLIRLKDR